MFPNSQIQPHNFPQSFTITDDSNIPQIPLRKVTQHPNIDQTQDNTSTLSTLDTTVTQQFQTQHPSPRNYDPSPIPPQYSTQPPPHNSPQQGSSETNGTNILQAQSNIHFQTTTPSRQPNLQTLSKTPAPTTQIQIIQPGLTINTLHSNTLSNHITSRSLS